MTRDAVAVTGPAAPGVAARLRIHARAELADFAAFVRRPVRYPRVAAARSGWVVRVLFFALLALTLDLPLTLLIDWLGGLTGIEYKVPTDNRLAFGLLAIGVAPAGEELLFRAGMRNAAYTLLFFPVLFFGYFAGMLGGAPYVWGAVAAALPVLLLSRLLRPARRAAIRRALGRRYAIVFWLYAVLFGLMHIANYSFTSKQLVVMPLFVLPQLVAGAVFGYLRLRDGLRSSWLAHMLNNAFGVILLAFFG
jgi:hypothetical protein